MIYTCTLNPSIDYIVQVDDLQIGELNRAMGTNVFPGGKGINVSRVLKRLGTDNTALGFMGGFTGQFIVDELEKEGIHHSFITVDGPTRINIKLKSGTETEINGVSPTISEEYMQELFHKLSGLTEGDVLVLAGSLPSSIPSDFYVTIMKKVSTLGVKVVVDTSGPALSELISHKPFLIKPNHHELGELFDTTVASREEAVIYGKKLVQQGVANVIVSMAGEGALLLNENVTLFATAPKGQVKNSVGAGDSMLAGFLSAYIQEQQIEKAFQYSVATGSATAFSQDLCTKDYVEQLVQEVKITHL